MAFYFSRRKLKPREEEEAGELNIVPYLDILMNLILFMLLSITGLASFGILNVSAPNYGGPAAGVQQDNPDQPKLHLSVLISKKGLYINSENAILGAGRPRAPPTIPLKADGIVRLRRRSTRRWWRSSRPSPPRRRSSSARTRTCSTRR